MRCRRWTPPAPSPAGPRPPRLNASPELLALDPGLQVTLVTEAMTDSHVTAYLEWQGTTGPERGPSVDIGVLDAPLGPAQYVFFARSLTEATNLP